MFKKSKVLLPISLIIALLSIFALGITNSKVNESYVVSKNGEKIAKLSIDSNKRFIKAVIQRSNQPAHTFTKSLKTNDVTVKIGDEEVLTYNNKSGDYQLQNLENSSYEIPNIKSNVSKIKWTENETTEKSLAIQNLLADDMKIFRVIRNISKSLPTRSFELAYVILTADESIYWSKEFKEYKVEKLGKTAGNSFVKSSFVEAGWGTACDSRLAACKADVEPNQIIECYRIADDCHSRCEPAPVGTPEA